MGRITKEYMTKMMTLRIDADLLARLKDRAKREGRSASAEVVRLLRRELGGISQPKRAHRSAMGMFSHLESVEVEEVRELRTQIGRQIAARLNAAG